jgi:hypothetical protein
MPIPHILYQNHHKYTAYCVFLFTRKRLPDSIFQISDPSILLKLLKEEERIDAAIATITAFAAVVIRAEAAERNIREFHGMTFVTNACGQRRRPHTNL